MASIMARSASIRAPNLTGLGSPGDLVPRKRERADPHDADLGDVAQDGDAELTQ
jgi:hypothetical protein